MPQRLGQEISHASAEWQRMIPFVTPYSPHPQHLSYSVSQWNDSAKYVEDLAFYTSIKTPQSLAMLCVEFYCYFQTSSMTPNSLNQISIFGHANLLQRDGRNT